MEQHNQSPQTPTSLSTKMVESEQMKPLSPISIHQSRSNEAERPKTTHLKTKIRPSRCIKCYIGGAILLAILVVGIVTLIFTLFKVKDPIISINGTPVTLATLVSSAFIQRPGTNLSLTIDVSVKNPNFVSFKYNSNTSTSIYYRGTVIGEARGPPGQSKARKTMRENVTVDIVVDSLQGIMPNLVNDSMSSGLIIFNCYTRVGGRANFLNFIKKHVIVSMNCTMAVHITSNWAIEQQKCKRRFKF